MGRRTPSRSRSRSRPRNRSHDRGYRARARSCERGRDRSSDRRRDRSRGRHQASTRDHRDRGGREDKRDYDYRRDTRRNNDFRARDNNRGPAKEEAKEGITDEQRANSIKFKDYLYATMDFHKPDDPKFHQGQRHEIAMPPGWEFVSAEKEIVDEVVMTHSWGTMLMIFEDGKTYATATGEEPGHLKMIWDIEKIGPFYKPIQRGSLKTQWSRILIRSCKPEAPGP
mmetsp:Transcript_86162/g.136010  ORF Transcript_86162/g.136010 Transcript_86162/m.136010 type:complete len:226 (+) Transcript_86162:56-733(+)